jgi:hypothetical protein
VFVAWVGVLGSNISMQYGASQENLLQTILSIGQFSDTIHCSHTKLLKFCHETQKIKKQCKNQFPIIKIKDNINGIDLELTYHPS